jgi:Ca-activated chloride channel family protein
VSVIESLYPGGGTYGSGGIQMAYSIALANKAPGVNRVILVTDGDFNVGVTSHEELVRMIEQNRRSGVALTTVGVGQGNLNDALLEQLANKGDGNYFYLDSFREAQRIFEDKLAGAIETVAKDVKLQMEFNPKNVVQYKLIGYENRMLAKQDFNNDAVDAGEIGAGHTVTALYELVMAGSAGATALVDSSRYQAEAPQKPVERNGKLDGELGFLKIRFKAPEGQSSELLEFPVAMSDLRTDVAQTTPDFKFAAAIAGFAQSLRGALPAGMALDPLIALAESGVGSDLRGERREAIELMKMARTLQKQFVAPVPSVAQPRYE